jgi:hypothetical protein
MVERGCYLGATASASGGHQTAAFILGDLYILADDAADLEGPARVAPFAQPRVGGGVERAGEAPIRAGPEAVFITRLGHWMTAPVRGGWHNVARGNLSAGRSGARGRAGVRGSVGVRGPRRFAAGCALPRSRARHRDRRLHYAPR